jgi:Bifunctional DNA primase/polymerase, N-terminal.
MSSIRVRGLKTLALRLHDLGFNVVPVGPDKRPLCKWSSRERISREELVKLLSKATGVGVVGGPVNPFKPVSVLVLVDIDKPSALDKYPGLKSIVESYC